MCHMYIYKVVPSSRNTNMITGLKPHEAKALSAHVDSVGELVEVDGGASCRVFVDKSLNKIVKIIHTHRRDLFQREVSCYKAIERDECLRDSVPRVLSSFTANNAFFMIMSHAGEDASNMISDNALTITEWFLLADQMPYHIDALHKKRIAHCDIKLENVVFKNNRWRLIDFGHSRVDVDVSRTNRYETAGTYPFVLPYAPYSFQTKDRFAFALTLLAALGYEYDNPEEKTSTIEIADLRHHYDNGTIPETRFLPKHAMAMKAHVVDVLRPVIEIVFSQIDPRIDRLVWHHGSAHKRPIYMGLDKSIDGDKYKFDIDDAWSDLKHTLDRLFGPN